MGLLPGTEVEVGDEGMAAGQHFLWGDSEGEGVCRDLGDVGVVTYDAGHGDSMEVNPLGTGEYPLSLPPESDRETEIE